MPINIMLVDDEIIVRLGMKSVIDWEANGFRFIGEASDGIEALELMEHAQPDILLTDMKMPNMNGIELIETVKRRYPQVRIIVLSSYDEYDYVRSAMKSGADDYILKASVDPDKLIQILQEMTKRISKEDLQQLPEAVDNFKIALRRSLDGTPIREGIDLKEQLEHFASMTHYLIVAKLEEGLPLSSSASSTVTTLGHVLELNARKWTEVRLLRSTEQEIVLVITMHNVAAPEQLLEIGTDLVSAAKRFAEATIAVGISGACHEAMKLSQAYKQAKQMLDQLFFDDGAKIFVFDKGRGISETILFSKQDERELVHEVESLDIHKIKSIIHRVMVKIRNERQPMANNIQACLEMFYCLQTAFRKLADPIGPSSEAEQPAYSQIIEFKKLTQAEAWFDHYVSQCLDNVRTISRDRVRDDILTLMAYLKSHYSESFSLKQAAEMSNVSEGYLSFLFKKETGTGFTEYVNGLRIDKAAELLRETHLPSYTIAEKVGYDNVNYFGRIFKKIKGVSPKRYRKNYSAKSWTSSPLE